jgi:uncharacterized protein (UPF0147 family)
VFARLRTKQHRRQLLRTVVDDHAVPRELAKLEVAKDKRRATMRQVNRAIRAAI